MRVEELFDPKSFDSIQQAVQEAELRTSGEIVPMVVPRSDAYTGVRAVTAGLLAFAAGVVLWSWLEGGRLPVGSHAGPFGPVLHHRRGRLSPLADARQRIAGRRQLLTFPLLSPVRSLLFTSRTTWAARPSRFSSK